MHVFKFVFQTFDCNQSHFCPYVVDLMVFLTKRKRSQIIKKKRIARQELIPFPLSFSSSCRAKWKFIIKMYLNCKGVHRVAQNEKRPCNYHSFAVCMCFISIYFLGSV